VRVSPLSQVTRLTLSAVAFAVLTACGGGSGSDTASTSATTVSGTAAAGLPLVGNVTVKDATGTTKTAAIGSNGGYSVDVSDMTAPFVLRAEGSAGGTTYTLYSAATEADKNGTINITPLTDLILSNVAGKLASQYFAGADFSGLTAGELDAEADKLKEKLLPVLQALGVDDATDLLRTPFTPLDSELDQALDALRVSYDSESNIATITNILTEQAIEDDLATKAAAESEPTTLDDTAGLSSADKLAADKEAIAQALTSFTTLFATLLPTAEAIQARMTTDFLDSDLSAEQLSSQLAGDDSVIGLHFTDLVFNKIDYTDPQNPVADVSYVDKTDNTVIGYSDNFKLKKVNGSWKLHGNQRVFDISASVHIVKTTYQDSQSSSVCTGSGLEFWVEDLDDSNSAGVASFVVTGPGLPSAGIAYVRPSLGGPFQFDDNVGQIGTWYQLTNTCSGSATADASEANIQAIPNNATYVMTMYDSDGEVLTSVGNNGQYRGKMGVRPMTKAEAAASTAFPSITSPVSFNAFVADVFTAPTVTASNLNTAFDALMYSSAVYDNGEVSGEADVIPNSSGIASHAFELTPPADGSLVRKEIRVQTNDSGRRTLMTQYLWTQ